MNSVCRLCEKEVINKYIIFKMDALLMRDHLVTC